MYLFVLNLQRENGQRREHIFPIFYGISREPILSMFWLSVVSRIIQIRGCKRVVNEHYAYVEGGVLNSEVYLTFLFIREAAKKRLFS